MNIRAKDCSPKELYKLMTGSIVPRPIALVSTKNTEGVYNLSPFSFFTVIEPPVIMFTIGERKGQKKDTLRNIENNPEFVINIVNEKLAQQMHNSAANFKPEINEFDEVNLTPVYAQAIDGVSVKESPIHLECVLDEIIKKGRSYMVFGKVVHFVIDDSVYIGNYKVDFQKLNALGRLSGNKYALMDRQISLERSFDPAKVL